MTRWRKFSLRTFLLAVTLLSVVLAWIAAERAQTARENAAAAYLTERDAFLMQGNEWSPRTGWWKEILGENLAAQHRSAHLDDSKVVDDDVARLRDLPKLEKLFLGEKTTNDGLAHLRGHPGISLVFIDGAFITDDGLAVLRTLPRLKELVLWRTPITGTGLVHLSGLNLHSLDICQSPIRDEHLRYLQQLTHIERLDIGDTPITDAGLVHLHSIKSLREVNLTLCPVTEEGVDTLLAANPKLIVLDRFRPRGTRVITY
jgi:hypothetical protein